MARKGPVYTQADLYGSSGAPQGADVDQDRLYDCYLLAPMAALAAQQPDRIRDAIGFRADPDDLSRSTFSVELHHPVRGKVSVEVTQDELANNIRRGGGSTADNRSGGPLWPAVIETAFAKLYDRDPGRRGLDEGYSTVARESGGGTLSDGIYALTGDNGRKLRISGGPPSTCSAAGKGEAPPFTAPRERSEEPNLDEARDEVSKALREGRPVTLGTRGCEEVGDGLMEGHGYAVTDIQQRQGETWISLRNPYGENRNVGEGRDQRDAVITVSLDELVRKGSLGEINVGPARGEPVRSEPASTPAPAGQGAAPPAQGAAPAGAGEKAPIALLDAVGADPAAFRQALGDAARQGREALQQDPGYRQAQRDAEAAPAPAQAQDAPPKPAEPAEQAAPMRRM